MSQETTNAKVASLGLDSVWTILVQQLGPVVAELIIDVISNIGKTTPAPHAQTAMASSAPSAVGMNNLLLVLLQQYGPALIAQLGTAMAASTDPTIKIIGVIVNADQQQILTSIENLLQSPQGAAAIANAIAASQK